ncbi:glutathione peroxidase [Acidocella sp.]|uniref:glutathione peroxidase n=1 Tax=Acidocella sp. TaxID=50710 RepID=UPI00261DA4ED|nr:glutathione peroxidase [Acidocella sp.]
MASAYDFSFTTPKGADYPLAQHRGKPMLVVNTASKCGFTPQYEALQELTKSFPQVVIIGVPCNDFGGQEPGTADQIDSFCVINYGVSFPIMGKVTTKGPEAHPFFTWVQEQGGSLAKPRWNFYKYIIDQQGALADYFISSTSPASKRFIRALEKVFYG